jgi:predicted transcriptional regulator
MTGIELVENVQKLKNDGLSFSQIGKILNLSKPTVRRIYLTKKIPPCAKKNLEPSPKLKATRERREKLDKIALFWKYENWSNYETACIRDFESDGLL